MKSPFAGVLFMVAAQISGCGAVELASVSGVPPGEEEAEVLSLAASGTDFFCPAPFVYNASSRLCESDREAVGPFSSAMVARCTQWGGGSACSRDLWSRDFARKVRGTEVCPPGASRSAEGLCLEGAYAFGPFTKVMVERCKQTAATDVCESMRWDKSEALRLVAGDENVAPRFTFPFSGPADADYTVSPRNFGACRDGCARKHAGADLYGPVGRSVYAVGDGEVLDFYYFYDGTYALVIDHGDFIVRYGEIKGTLPAGVTVGAQVKRGQKVGWVGDLASLSFQMVHFERFSGAATGPLTVRSNPPYQRRSDLQNPTADLIKWKYPR